MNNIVTQLNYNQSVCTCPHCNSASLTRSGFDRGIQRFRCKTCHKTFKATAGTPVHGLHKKEKIAKYLKALQKGMSIRKAAEYANISNATSFAWRHKFLSSLESPSILRSTSQISSASIIQQEYSAKGRRKPPEKHTSPTKTIALLTEGQLELHKLSPIRQTRQITKIFAESACSFFVATPHKTITAGIKHSEGTIKIKNRKIIQPLIIKSNQQIAKLLIWMERFKGVASKYLHNYWNWYTSLHNLGELKHEFEHFCIFCTNRRSLPRYINTKNA